MWLILPCFTFLFYIGVKASLTLRQKKINNVANEKEPIQANHRGTPDER